MFLVRSCVSVSEVLQGRVTLTMARVLPKKHVQVLEIRSVVSCVKMQCIYVKFRILQLSVVAIWYVFAKLFKSIESMNNFPT